MANILSLALKVNADASGVVKNLTPAERALEKLATEADKATKVFDQFASSSTAATAAQARADEEFQSLSEQLKSGAIGAKQFAEDYAKLTETINKEAAAFKRAADITRANISPQEKYADAVDELNEQLKAGRISQETYNRAMEKAKQDLDKAGDAAKKTDKTMEDLSKNVRMIANIQIGRLLIDGLQAIGNAFRSIINQVSSFVSTVNKSLDTLNDFSQRTGVDTKSLQAYSVAANLAGVDTEQFLGAVQKLAVNIGKSAPGDALDKSLKQINLSVSDLRKLSPEKQFDAIALQISKIPTAAGRAAAAVELFGKQGAALGPLFKEGAAGLEEIKARAERLGIIVSNEQIDNVTRMNDAFDLVRMTVEGIAGQVLGNLANAVTAVLDDLLRFVETYKNEAGEVGGNAFASAITDAFISGGKLFIGILERFAIVAKEVAAALGVDLRSDAEKELGRLQAQAAAGLAPQVALDGAGFVTQVAPEWEARLKELQDKVAQEQKDSAFQTVRDFLLSLEEEIKKQRTPQFQVETNIEETRKRFDAFFQGVADAEGDVSAAMKDFEIAVNDVADPTAMTADEMERIGRAQEAVNALLDAEIVKREDAAAKAENAAKSAEKQVEDERKRIAALLETNDQAAKIESDLLVVQREQARVEEQLAAARAAGNQEEANANTARLAELDQLRASLEEDQQALEQGFGQGFQAAFDAVDKSISGLIDKSQQFGQAGFDAAVRLQEGIKAAQEQASAGILNEEAFNREVERQKQLYDDELKRLDDVAKAKQKAEEDAVAAAQKQQEDVQRAQDEYQKQQADAVQKYQEQQQKQYEEYAKAIQAAAEKEAARQEERIKKLNTLGEQKISVNDVRTAEGAALVLGLIANGQDPALIQARLQTKYLERIALGIGQAASNYFNQPVAIVGAANFGG